MRAILAAVLVCASLGSTEPSWPQNTAPPDSARQRLPAGTPPSPGEIEMQRRAAKQRNQERYAKVKKDTDQLLVLATQLKKSVDEAGDQKLSLEVVRKAEQIEKLAKQVRQKMLAE
jgi:hypothetical protein